MLNLVSVPLNDCRPHRICRSTHLSFRCIVQSMAVNRSLLCVLVAVTILTCLPQSHALVTEGKFDGLSKRLWEAKDGLPDQTVTALAQTPDGSLWIGTEGGLVRFDGVRFSTYGPDVIPGGIEQGVNALLVSSDGDLWIGTEGGGVIRYHNRRFERCASDGVLENLFVRVIYQDRSKMIWVGSDQGLFRLE